MGEPRREKQVDEQRNQQQPAEPMESREQWQNRLIEEYKLRPWNPYLQSPSGLLHRLEHELPEAQPKVWKEYKAMPKVEREKALRRRVESGLRHMRNLAEQYKDMSKSELAAECERRVMGLPGL